MQYVPTAYGQDPLIDVVNLTATVVNNDHAIREQILQAIPDEGCESLSVAAVKLLSDLICQCPSLGVAVSRIGKYRLEDMSLQTEGAAVG